MAGNIWRDAKDGWRCLFGARPLSFGVAILPPAWVRLSQIPGGCADMTNPSKPSIIVISLPKRHVPIGPALAWAAKARGIGRWRIALDIAARMFGRQKLLPDEYFMFGLHRPGMTDHDRSAFLGGRAIKTMNKALVGDPKISNSRLMDNKLKMAMVLERAGLPTTELRAVYVPQGKPGPWPVLRNATEIAAFLMAPGTLPLFGKPVFGSRSVGVLSLMSAHGTDEIALGDGRRVSAMALAQELVANFGKGYLFQELLRPHPDLERITGPAIGSLRVYSLWENAAAVPLYLVLRLPAAGAMADDLSAGAQSGAAQIDMATGLIDRAHQAQFLGGNLMEVSPATGVPLVGAAIPDLDQAIRLVAQAHEMFYENSVIGFDIALTNRGPVINELNPYPLQGIYQRASGKGILNDTFRPRLKNALIAKGLRGRELKRIIG